MSCTAAKKQNTKITSPNIYTSDALEPLIETKTHLWCNSFSQSVASASPCQCVSLDILKHEGLFLYWSKAALLRKGCNLSARRICWQLPGTNIGSKQAKAMPESTSMSLSPSKTPSTAGLLLWRRDGWRLHVLLLPCQCLQWKCGLVIGYINIDA